MRLKGTGDFNFKFQLENFFGLAGNDKERKVSQCNTHVGKNRENTLVD